MKHAPLRPITAACAALLSLAGLAHAHPGHSAIDWFTAAPHAGHESEYGVWFSALGISTLAYGIYRLGMRKR